MPGSTAPSQPIPGLPADARPAAGGVLDSLRDRAVTAVAAARRHRLAVWSEVALIALYLGLRVVDADRGPLTAWLAAVIVLSFLSPTSGLVILAAIAPFNEALELRWDVGSKSAIAIAVVAAVAVRWVSIPSARARPSASVVLASALVVATALGLIRTQARWGTDFALLAAGTWLSGIATMLLVFIAMVWVARGGERRPLVAALAATTVAGLLSLVDFWGDAALRDGPLGWAVSGPFSPDRLTGVIRSPTSTAALVMLPISVYLAAAILGQAARLRVAAAALAAPLLAAAYLTYNRAVFIALYAIAVIVGWRIGRRLGIALLVGGMVIGAVLVPWYVSVRGQAIGGSSALAPGQVLIASDQQRLGAWAAAGRMFLDEPILGQGYRAYRQLSVAYGDPILNAPHNEWLRLFAEHGALVGLAGLAFVLTTGIRLARGPGWLGAGLFASFLSLCIAASFNNVFLFNQVTIPAMVMAGTGVARAGRRTSPVGEDA
ncbi:MAG: O-antigen ligase family protein [Chloroflexota bacterium]